MAEARIAHADLVAIRTALYSADNTCRYHGTDFGPVGDYSGLPRCDSCKQPYRVTLALAALKRIDAGIEADRG